MVAHKEPFKVLFIVLLFLGRSHSSLPCPFELHIHIPKLWPLSCAAKPCFHPCGRSEWITWSSSHCKAKWTSDGKHLLSLLTRPLSHLGGLGNFCLFLFWPTNFFLFCEMSVGLSILLLIFKALDLVMPGFLAEPTKHVPFSSSSLVQT